MSLQLSVAQDNDAKTIYLTDTSTWDDGDELDFNWADITAASLVVSYNTTDNKDFDDPTVPSTSPIDITSIFTEATSQDDLIFELDSSDLGLGDDTEILDGIWKFVYYVTDGTNESTLEIDVNLDQIIQNGLYKRFASIPLMQFCNCRNMTENIDDIIIALGIQWSVEVASTVARKSNILDTQETLKRFITNYPYGTNIK